MINQTPLETLIESIVKAKTIQDLSPEMVVAIIRACIEHEVRPGGPYRFNAGVSDEAIGLKLKQLFDSNATRKDNRDLRRRSHGATLAHSKLKKTYSQHQLNISSGFSTSAKNLYTKTVSRLESADTRGEISLLSYFFLESLKSPSQIPDNTHTSRRLQHMTQANIHTWVAYSIIDKLLDDQNDEPHALLEVALGSIRQSLHLYGKAGAPQSLLESLYSKVDTANTNELEARQLINIIPGSELDEKTIVLHDVVSHRLLRQLMNDKSIAHTIGPRSLLSSYPKKLQNQAAKAFELYCGARQLLDDMHDWQADLANGQLTYVIGKLFTHSGITPGRYELKALTSVLKIAFWESVLQECCEEILQMTQESRSILEEHFLKEESSFIHVTLIPIQAAAEKALRDHFIGKSLAASFTPNTSS